MNKIVLKDIKKVVLRKLNSDVSSRIFKGTIWGALGGLFVRIFTIVFSFLLARVLGSVKLGEYGMINTTTSTITGLAGLGLGATVNRFSAALILTDRQRLGRIIGLTFVIGWISSIAYGVIYYFLADWIAAALLDTPHLGELMKISSLTFVFGLINSIQMSSLSGLEAFKTTSILTSITTILQTLFVLVCAYLFSIRGAIISGSISALIVFIIFYIYSRKEYLKRGIVVSYKNLQSELGVVWNYSLPAFLSSLIVGPVIWITNTLLIKQPNGFHELGVVNVALQWESAVKFLPLYIGTAAIPVMTDITLNRNYRDGFILTMKLMKTVFIITFPIAIAIAMLAPNIIKGYGDSFKGGEYVIVVTAFTAVLVMTSNQLGSFISATGKMWLGLVLNLIWGMSFILLSLIFLNTGSTGFVNAKLFSYGIHMILSIALCGYLSRSNIDG